MFEIGQAPALVLDNFRITPKIGLGDRYVLGLVFFYEAAERIHQLRY